MFFSLILALTRVVCIAVKLFFFLKALSQSLREVMDRMTAANSERQQLDEECQEQVKQRTKLELDIKDLERNVREDSAQKVILPLNSNLIWMFPLASGPSKCLQLPIQVFSQSWWRLWGQPKPKTNVTTGKKLSLLFLLVTTLFGLKCDCSSPKKAFLKCHSLTCTVWQSVGHLLTLRKTWAQVVKTSLSVVEDNCLHV